MFKGINNMSGEETSKFNPNKKFQRQVVKAALYALGGIGLIHGLSTPSQIQNEKDSYLSPQTKNRIS